MNKKKKAEIILKTMGAVGGAVVGYISMKVFSIIVYDLYEAKVDIDQLKKKI